jgi:excisionase family DNA binding protein
LLSVKEAAVLIGVGRTTIYKLMDGGDLAYVHVGKSRRIPLKEAHDFVERLCLSSELGIQGRIGR